MALARDAVQHVENLDQGERRSLLQRVEQELAELTGEASERDVAARVGEILDAGLGELGADDEDDGYDDEYDEEDDEDGDEDDQDDEDEDDE